MRAWSVVAVLLACIAASNAYFDIDEGICSEQYLPEVDTVHTVCEFDFHIDHEYTMTYNGQRVVSDCVALNGENTTCVACTMENPDCAGTDDAIDFETIKRSADGFFRRVITVNGQIPGPAIRVKYGSFVRVTLHNHMMSDATTMHWHGLYQTNTPWMDGVPYISQCPILPSGSKFTYQFSAQPAGTFWYHSHTGVQFSEGVAGPIIIYEEDEPNQQYYDFNVDDVANGRVPEYDSFYMMLSDWQHEESHHIFQKLFKAGGWYDENGVRFEGAHTFDGLEISPVPFESGIINGRGRYSNDDPQGLTPYYGFQVKPGKRYRFRAIGATMIFAFRISIDDHKMKVITSDGYDVNPREFDYIIISGGERFDFVLETKTDPGQTEYVIRADTMRFDEVNQRPFNDSTTAVLRYGETTDQFLTDTLPPAIWRPCNRDTNPCITLNCPFGNYPSWSHTRCAYISDLVRSSREVAKDPTPQHVTKEEQIFMNFVFGGHGGLALGVAPPGQKPAPVVNGQAFVGPSELVAREFNPATTFSKCDEVCDDSDNHNVCRCTNFVNMEEDNYQLVFTSVGSGGSHNGSIHPIHIHGHSLLVTRMGFPEQDSDGKYIRANQDLCCPCPEDETQCCSLDSVLIPCNKPRWRNETWNEDPDSIPMNVFNPPRKDTVLLPAGGYIVTRFIANNPGWWFLHCHIEHHLLGGMAILLNVKPNEHPSPPAGFPTCTDFNWANSDFFEKYRDPEPDLDYVSAWKPAYLDSGDNPHYGTDVKRNTCARLDAAGKTWWKVDLLEPHNVYRVILKNADVSLAGSIVRVGSEEDVELHHQCGQRIRADRLPHNALYVECVEPIVGRYVSIQSPDGVEANICEVVVRAPADPTTQPTFDSGCGIPHDWTDASGAIYSMNYDGVTLYENSARCEFKIKVLPDMYIKLNFEHFDLEPGYDYVWINGPNQEQISQFTGSDLPEETVHEYSTIFVRFTSDVDGQATGFRATYEAVPRIVPNDGFDY